LIGRHQVGDALHPGSIAPIFKRVAHWIGMQSGQMEDLGANGLP
jgi:hypothetical protein